MDRQQRVRTAVLLVSLVAVACLFISYLATPPNFSEQLLTALGTLLILALLSTSFALKVTEHGATVSTVFIPYLSGVLLAPPAAAATLVAVAETLSQSLIARKPFTKAAFNVSQLTIAVALASWTFKLFGGDPSLTSINLADTAVPFLLAATVYFGVNHIAVSYIVSLAEAGGLREMWDRLLGKTVFFDVAISPIAYLVAFLYIWLRHPAGLLLAIVPMIGLRYIYGANVELRNLNRDLLRVLIKTLEAQDPYTSGHSLRVAERSKQIAKELGLGFANIHQIETAALLHDLGKIDNAYHDLLRQEGPLTPKQRQLIHEHPQRGVNIVRSIRSVDAEVLEYIKHHHERYDGDGYPDGLEGEDIPLGARIIMVADTIDAMLTTRPYREPLTPDVVRDELIDCSGTQFDPDVVQATLDAEVVELTGDPASEHVGLPA